MEAGKHGFDGAYKPGNRHLGYTQQQTFSLGIFEWLPKSNGKGVKRSAVKVRVKGHVSNAVAVEAKAHEIAGALDAGTYDGPKTVTVK